MAAVDPLLAPVLDALSSPTGVLGPDGVITSVNAAWADASSHPWAGSAARVGTDYAGLLDTIAGRERGDAQRLAAMIRAALARSSTSANHTYVVGDAHAGTHWRTSVIAVADPTPRTVVVHEDVSARRRAEAALKRSQARLRTILTGAPLTLFSLDARGVFTLVEGMGAASGGFVGPEQVGQSVFSAYAHMPALLGVVEGAIAGRIGVATVHVGRLAFEVRCSPLLGADDELEGVVGVATDVSERMRIQRMRDEFVSLVSHELRTPLTSIRGSLGLLEAGVAGALAGRALELVRIARINSDRLIRLISDILDVDKMEAGLLELVEEPIDLVEVVEAAALEMSGLAEHVGVAIERATAPVGAVLGDRDRLIQVLANLLSNAIKFSPPGAEVVIALTRRGSHARIEVVDRGPGIAPEDFGRLFQRFSQLDASDSRAKGGSGLGLVICKSIVEALGGRIGVDSRPGHGSTFWVELPLAADEVVVPSHGAGELRERAVAITRSRVVEPRRVGARTRIREIELRLTEAADSGDATPLADAHAAATILAAGLPADAPERAALSDLCRVIDRAMASDDDRRQRAAAALATFAELTTALLAVHRGSEG